MRILTEALPQIATEDIKQWSKASYSEKMRILNKLLPQYGRNDLKNIIESIIFDFDNYGIDPAKNPFVELLGKFKFQLTKNHNNYLQKLTQLRSQKDVDVSKDYLALESLYKRNIDDFIYTVVLFDTVNDPRKLNKFFKDTTYINEADLYVKGTSNVIKPAGNEGDGIDTLYGTVESWAGDNGENNASYNKTEQGGFSLNQVFKQNQIAPDEYEDTLIDWVYDYFDEATKQVELLHDDVEYYLSKLKALFRTNIKSLNTFELNKIRKQHAYDSIEYIPEKEEKLNNVVWIKYKHLDKKNNDIYAYMDDKNRVEDFIIFTLSGWKLYKQYQQVLKNSSMKKFKDVLFNQRSIKDTNNKITVVAGVLKILDSLQIRQELL